MDAPTVPSFQHRYEGLPKLDERTLYRRREGLFLVLAGLFLGTLAMLNILGITRFIVLLAPKNDAGEAVVWGGVPLVFAVAVGVLPYPITFLCTDFISELYGKARANAVVWTGFLLNVWVVFILWLGGVLPGFEQRAADGSLVLDAAGREPVFFEVRTLAFGAVVASMIAYLVAQLVDVHVFHFWKRVTKGRHLWLRNNGSTLVSQLVDSTAVILITHFYARALPVDAQSAVWPQLLVFIFTGYMFKVVAAGVDTVPFMLGAPKLARWLRLPPPHHYPQHHAPAAAEAGVG
ncbi:MAG: queuosine precursor transporter [Phycisphaerales bacterium]